VPIEAVLPSVAMPMFPTKPEVAPIKPKPAAPTKAVAPSDTAPTVPVKPGVMPKLSFKPSRKPSSRNQTRPSSAPSCSFITETMYLESPHSVTFSDNFLEVEFSSEGQLTAFQIDNYNYSFIDTCSLYGYVGGEWSFLTGKFVNDNKFVYFPPATFQKYRLTFQKIYPSQLLKDNIKFLMLYTAQCDKEKSYKFFTNDELKGIVLRYTDAKLKKQVIQDYGVMNCWDVSKVTDMSGLFSNIISFDEDISCWDTSKVRNMSKMFANATSFNRDLGRWNVSEVEDFREMFSNAMSFQKPLSGWNVFKAKSMAKMFYNASMFNQDCCSWYNKISAHTMLSDIFGFSSCIDKSEPNITSKTSFCTECSCCGKACFYPVARCEVGYTCDEISSKCRKPIYNETCRVPRGDSYGCKNGYMCLISNGSKTDAKSPYKCNNPTINNFCVEEIGCSEGYRCSNSICQVSTYGQILIIYR
jgi:surface protein